mmetsp:Transcript_1195/g.3572  ORF Transcript_1195/g.3572 Transcript_1195/m.3572 type:complete len:143 (+) Transcript_1195:769-1197(+)
MRREDIEAVPDMHLRSEVGAEIRAIASVRTVQTRTGFQQAILLSSAWCSAGHGGGRARGTETLRCPPPRLFSQATDGAGPPWTRLGLSATEPAAWSILGALPGSEWGVESADWSDDTCRSTDARDHAVILWMSWLTVLLARG